MGPGEVSRRMGGAPGEAAPAVRPGRVLPALALAAAAWLTAAPAQAVVRLVVAAEDAAGATNDLYFLDLATGATFEGNPRRSGERMRIKSLEQNVFQVIGRRSGDPAPVGHFLLGPIYGRNGRTERLLMAETPTGFMAVLSRLGRGGLLGEIRALSGRPGSTLMAGDGNFALLMRRVPGGRTVGAYLYHGTTGRCLALSGLDDEEAEPASEACSGLPRIAAGLEVAPLERSDGSTLGYLVVDGSTGAVYRIGIAASNPARLTATRLALELGEVFPGAAGDAPPRRFAMAPVSRQAVGTDMVLVVDAHSGRLALLRNVASRPAPSAALLPGDVFGAYLPRGRRDRVLLLVPRAIAPRESDGAWLFDSVTNRILLLDGVTGDEGLRIIPVEILD